MRSSHRFWSNRQLHLPATAQTTWNIYPPSKNSHSHLERGKTHNQGGAITHYTNLEVRTGEQKKTLRFLITNLGRDEVILGYPWFTAFEPKFHWQDATLDEEFHPVIVSSLGLRHPYHPLESTICKMTTATSLAQQAAGKIEPKPEELIPPEYL